MQGKDLADRATPRPLHYGSSNLSAAFANIETGIPSAAAMPRTVTQDGFPSPRSISESMFGVIPAACASFSWLSPRLVRSVRIALPRTS